MLKNSSDALTILLEDADRVISCMDFSALANKDVMITGANGLIGINFLFTFIQMAEIVPGINIIPVIHSEPSFLPKSFFQSKKIHFIKGDLTDESFCEKLPTADIIIHAAGSGEPNKFVSEPMSSLKINTVSTFRLFEKLNKNGSFLFISSSDVYNGLTSKKYSENQIGTNNTDHPRACYIEGKRTGETICNIFRYQGVNAFSVRLALTYGPGMRMGDQRVLPSFIQKGLTGKIQLLDSGNANRTFCYVSDAIKMMLHIIMNGKERLYNVGGVTSCKISELACLIGNICKVPVVIPKTEGGIIGAPENVFIDINRFLGEFKMGNFVGLEEGLNRTINWYKVIEKRN